MQEFETLSKYVKATVQGTERKQRGNPKPGSLIKTHSLRVRICAPSLLPVAPARHPIAAARRPAAAAASRRALGGGGKGDGRGAGQAGQRPLPVPCVRVLICACTLRQVGVGLSHQVACILNSQHPTNPRPARPSRGKPNQTAQPSFQSTHRRGRPPPSSPRT